MFNITVDRPAEEMLLWLKLRDRVIHGRIAKAIDELEQKGIHHTQIYRLSDPDPIYRRRIGRWRIIFTLEPGDEIAVWIIDIEKDTKKDYGSWIAKIKQRRRLLFG